MGRVRKSETLSQQCEIVDFDEALMDAFAPETRADLLREARLLASFSPYRPDVPADRRTRVPPFIHNVATHVAPELERPGPILHIWQIP